MGRVEEIFEIVDDEDRVIGHAPRSQCHGNPELVHRVSHVLMFNRSGELLLQKRALHKDVQPGKWDTSVGGHLDCGEDYLQAAQREMTEELGVSGVPLTFLYHSKIRNDFESENVATYLGLHNGPFMFAKEEISEVRFWSRAEIDSALGTGILTTNFEEEWGMLKDWWRRHPVLPQTGPGFCAGDSFPNLFAKLNED